MAKRKARKPSNIPADESKADRFIRVVSPRVKKAVKAINQIGQCAGGTYENTDAQADQIMEALGTALTTTDAKFRAKPAEEKGFEFTS